MRRNISRGLRPAVAAAASLAAIAAVVAAPAQAAPNGNATNRYTLVTTAATWVAADAAARAAGGHLVTITSATEQVRVADIAGAYEVWLGGTDAAIEGMWRWVDGGKFTLISEDKRTAIARGYNNWAQSEPNDSGSVEDCAVMTTSDNWNDLPCGVVRAYIIEYD
jgi:hypothetical protein